LGNEGKLLRVRKAVSRRLEAAGILKALEPRPVLFEKVKESEFRVAGNLFCTKDDIASYFGIQARQLIPFLTKGIDERRKPEVVSSAPCQEVVESDVDLNKLPILLHNVRVVKKRHFDVFLQKNGELEVAFCVGNAPNVLVAAATSVDLGVDELEIANALEPMHVVRAKSVDLLVPADCEFVLEGRVYLRERHDEGPFVDLTETYDIVRQEPVFEVKKITHREDAVWQALLPGALEHKVLMGMPREPTIYREVNAAGVRCLDVNVDPGGCSWLHAIVQIDKTSEEDGRKAIEAALKGHKSCKHVFVVDKDIDIYDPLQVEWAMATRFQGDVDMVMKEKEPGSSLDPSAEPRTKMTTKMGFDLTKPLKVIKGKNFERAEFPKVDLEKVLED